MMGIDYPWRKNFNKKICFLLFLFSLILPFTPLIHAEEQVKTVTLTEEEQKWIKDHPVITLGAPESEEPYFIVNADGTYSGILIDIYNALNKRLGTNISLKTGQWSELQLKSKNLSIDGLAAMKEEFADNLGLLKSNHYLTVFPVIYTMNNARINKPDDLKGKRIAIKKGANFAEEIVKPFEDDIEILRCVDNVEALQLVYEGKADVMVGLTINNYLISKYHLHGLSPAFILWDYPARIVAGTRPDWPEFNNILNKGISTLTEDEINGLVSKWYSMPIGPAGLKLEASEKIFLHEHHELRVAIDPYWAPVEYFDESGNPQGITIDFLNRVGAALNLSFEFVKGETWNDRYNKVYNKEVDLLPSLSRTEKRAARLEYTRPYISFPVMIFARKEVPYIADLKELNNRKVAVIKGFATEERLAKDFPEINLVRTDNIHDAVEALESGNAYACIGNMVTLRNQINRMGYHNLDVVGETPYTYDLCFAVRKDIAPLIPILQKALDSITEAEKNEIRGKWRIPIGYDRAFDYSLIWKGAVTAAVVILFIIFWNRRLAHEVAKRTKALELNKHIVSSSSIGTVVFRLSGECIMANKAAAQLIGKPVEEILKENFRQLKRWQDTGLLDLAEKALESEEEQAGEITNKGVTSGKTVSMHCRFLPFRFKKEKHLLLMFEDISERKRAEEALRENELKYRTLFNSASDAIFMMDGDCIVDCNLKTLEMFGCEREDIIGKPPAVFSPEVQPDGASSIEKAEQLIMQALIGNPQSFEWKHKRKDGTLFDADVTLNAIKVEKFRTVQAIIRDITERKRVEEALKSSEEKYRLIAENASDVIFTLDNNLNYTYISPSVERQRGFTPDEILNHGAVDFLSPSSRKIIKKLFEEEFAIEKEISDGIPRPRKMELEVYTREGNLLWVETVVSFIYDRNNHPVGILGTTRDITERNKAEEALRKSEEKFSKAFHASPDSISISLLESGLLLEINSGFERVFGYTREEALNRTSVELGIWMDPEDRNVMISEFREKGMVAEMQVDFRTKSENRITCLLSGVLITINDQEQALIVIKDITERKRAEEERAYLKTQLLQTQKMESLGVLAGGIAHDFNNILSSIFGYTELAKMSIGMGQNIDGNLDQVLNAATRAKNLVKHILTFSRQSDIQKNPTAVRPLIKETLKFIRSSIPATIEINYDLADKELMVLADPTQIHQIIMNLCTNAAHAMKDEGGILDVRIKEVEITDEATVQLREIKKGKYLQLTVSDTGTGIKNNVIDHIFDPFFTTKERGEGTGLGLSVIHGIVKDMGGAISVYSEPDKGTTFQILLPEFEGEAGEKTPEQQSVSKGEGRILLVDDEKAIVDSGQKILKGLGYDVTSSTSSIDALKIFESNPDNFDLVLTDMTMPKMTGLELSRKILKIRPEIPIILCTGYSLGLTEAMIRKNGIRQMIMKPIISRELAAAINDILKDKEK